MSDSHPFAVMLASRSLSPLSGTIQVPGDKSISHRSIMLGSLAEGKTHITGFLEGEDSLATLNVFRAMGVEITEPKNGEVTVNGVGLHGLTAPSEPLYLGNSGTSMRLLSGLLAAQNFDVTLTGDSSLTGRPMNRVVLPLKEMGANIDSREGGYPPLTIKGGSSLKGIDFTMPMASAQVKSALLLAGLYADGETSVTEPAPTRDHTERMLRGFGYPITVDGSRVTIKGKQAPLQGQTIEVPGDISSAAFFMVAASIVPNSEVTIKHVGINATRVGVVNILKLMGSDITLTNKREVGGEPVADITVRYSSLKGITIPVDQVPLAIDELPVLFIAAACAEGETILRGAEELRVKESDRIQVMADGLAAVGVKTEVLDDGLIITPSIIKGGAAIECHSDHRIAMSFAVASLVSESPIEIRDCANVATSFPTFSALANQVGFQLQDIDSQ